MECVGCGSAAVSERSERTAQDYRRFRCRVCGKQFNERSAGSLNRTQYPSDVIAPVVLWRLRYKLALRDLPEMFLIRGIVFSHEAVRDWEAKLTPALAESLRRRRRGKAGPSWYVDETYIKVHGHWRYLYRAIDRSGALVDVMFSEHRDMAAAKAFFESAKMVTGVTPDRVTTDGHDSYPRAIRTTLGAGLHLSHVPGIRARVTCARSRSGCPRRPAGTPGVVGGLPRHTAANPSIYLPPASSCRRTAPIPRRPLSDTSSRFQPCLVGATAAGNRAGCTRDRYGDRVDHSTWANNSALVPAHVSTNGSAVRIVRPDHTGSSPYTDSVDNVHQLDNTAAHQWVGPDGRAAGMTGSTPPPGVGWEQLKEGCLSATFKLRHNPSMRAPTRAKSDDQAGDVWTSMATEDIVLLGGHSTMAATAIQPTTTVSFRASGSKPSPVQVFVKAGQKWIVASEVCRILGIRTDSVPQLIPEKDRSRAAVLTKGSVQSVTTITEAGFNLLVAQSAKPAAKALREWMVGEVLPSIPRPPAPKVPVGQGDFF